MRIVSLISSGTEILFALGLGELVVAVSHECDYPAAALKLPRATRSWIDSSSASDEIDQQVKHCLAAGQPLYEIHAQMLCRLAPDLIVTQAQCDVCAVRLADVVDLVRSRAELQSAQVLAVNPQSLAEVLSDVRCVGKATGAADEATRLCVRLNERINHVSATTANVRAAERPRVVCLEWIMPLMAAGNWTPELIELAGGRSGLATPGRHSDYVAWNAIREFDPEVLLVAPCGFDLARSRREAELLRGLPGFAELRAVRAGRTFVIDGNAYLNRSGPRLVESLELLAALIQPERFPAPAGELAEGRAWSHL
jgi:iron complex transport system substrate-binding protein